MFSQFPYLGAYLLEEMSDEWYGESGNVDLFVDRLFALLPVAVVNHNPVFLWRADNEHRATPFAYSLGFR